MFFDDFSCFLGVFRGVGGVVQKGSKTVKNGLKWSKTVKNRGFRGPKPEKTRDTLLPINTILREIRPPPWGRTPLTKKHQKNTLLRFSITSFFISLCVRFLFFVLIFNMIFLFMLPLNFYNDLNT